MSTGTCSANDPVLSAQSLFAGTQFHFCQETKTKQQFATSRSSLLPQESPSARLQNKWSNTQIQRVTPQVKNSFGSSYFDDDSTKNLPHSSSTAQWTDTPKPVTLQCTRNNEDKSATKLRSTIEIPSRYRQVFSSFPYFNIVQSKVLDDVLYADTSLVISAPTGSGKTVIFELAIVRMLMQRSVEPDDGNINFKIVYIAPIKALCNERFHDWKTKFEPLGLRCVQLTGDTEGDDYFELQQSNIILTTPEKWDSMTRKWRDNASLVQMVKLILIDEVHMINDETRGATMEAVVSRMKTVQIALNWQNDGVHSLRFIAASASIPNINDVGEWLGTSENKAATYKINEDMRPVKLKKVILGYETQSTWNEFKFELLLDYKLWSIIRAYSENKPTLVFCSTRKGTVLAASTLVKTAKFVLNNQSRQVLRMTAEKISDSKLREMVLSGVGFHHAGLNVTDRKYVEEIFTKGYMPILVSTSTLAMGVNLPAHLVIIKSTMQYVQGKYAEYSEIQILQMIGRAGRPQFDTTGTAVIMTQTNKKPKYESLVNGTQVLESSLHKHLIEHLNAEIVLRTVTDISIAMEWIRSTFLYIRAMKNPKHYGIMSGLTKEHVENKLQEMCLRNLNALNKFGMIEMDENSFGLKPLELGNLMARYCIAFETMKSFTMLDGNESLCNVVKLIAECQEFYDIQLRVNEKKILNSLNNEKQQPSIRFTMNGKIKTRHMKVNCLIQAAFGSLSIQEPSLNQEISKILRVGQRLSKCLHECLHIQKTGFKCVLNSAILSKCFRAKIWENSPYVSRQIEKIGITLSSALVVAGIKSFDQIEDTNPRELELILNRHPPFGNQIQEAVRLIPKYKVKVEQSEEYRKDTAGLYVTVYLVNNDALQSNVSPSKILHSSLIIIGDQDNKLLLRQRLTDSSHLKSGRWFKRLYIHRATTGNEISVNLISEYYVGRDVHIAYIPRYCGNWTGADLTKRKSHLSKCLQSEDAFAATVIQDGTQGEKSQERNDERMSCQHRCLNKTTCAHECCKTGILNKRRRQMDEGNRHQTATPNKMKCFYDDLHSRANMVTDGYRNYNRVSTPIIKQTNDDTDELFSDKSDHLQFPSTSQFVRAVKADNSRNIVDNAQTLSQNHMAGREANLNRTTDETPTENTDKFRKDDMQISSQYDIDDEDDWMLSNDSFETETLLSAAISSDTVTTDVLTKRDNDANELFSDTPNYRQFPSNHQSVRVIETDNSWNEAGRETNMNCTTDGIPTEDADKFREDDVQIITEYDYVDKNEWMLSDKCFELEGGTDLSAAISSDAVTPVGLDKIDDKQRKHLLEVEKEKNLFKSIFDGIF